jgi:hypothetical protein
MKIGKFIPLGEYKEIKIGYGTVDHKNLKTIYIKLNSWVKPKDGDDNFDKIISQSRREIKALIREFDLKDLFKKESIVDLDIKTKGIKLDKRSFMNLEITLFVENHFDVKSVNVKNLIKFLSEVVVDDCLSNKALFNFNKTKD